MSCRNTSWMQSQGIAYAMLVVVASTPVLAGPIPGDPVVLSQPDGTTFVARAGGDEWFNWIACGDTLIARDGAGWWRYATVRAGVIQPGSAPVGRDSPGRGVATLADVPALAAAVERRPGTTAEPPVDKGRSASESVLVVLVEFQDRALTTSDAYWSDLFFGTSGKTVRTYYNEVSGGQFDILPAAETAGTASDGIVRVQLQSTDHNAGNHPDPYGTFDDRNRLIVSDALYRTAAYVQYGNYDTQAPLGYITPPELHVVVVAAGYEHGYAGDASPHPAVHGHRWVLEGTAPAPQVGGVYLCGWYGDNRDSGYMQVGELHGDPGGSHAATIGEICHELGHDLGLIDLYDYTSASHGIGAHGLMGYGVWGTAASDTYLGQTPVHMCAWSKEQLGFVTPTVATGCQEYTLWASGTPNYSVVRINNTRDPNQYFLVENRQLQGFDAGLYRWFSISSGGAGGGGLAIWHVDMAVSGNGDWTHKQVDLEEANTASVGYGELDYLTAGNPPPEQGNRQHYYYAGYRDYFVNGGMPNTRLYDGRTTYVNAVSISASDNRMKCFIAAQPGDIRQVEWGTYLGGAQHDRGYGLALDPSDNLYVVGDTNSTVFPTTVGAYDQTLGGTNALFVTKLSNTGQLGFSTFFHDCSTTSPPHASDVAVDPNGCAYLTGHTYGSLPTTGGAYDTTFGGGSYPDAFVTKFGAQGNALWYSTYIGGAQDDRGFGIALDSADDAHIAGQASDVSFPYTTRPIAYKLNPTGTGLLYSQLLGTGQGGAYGVTTDGLDNAYIVGPSRTGLYTTTGAYDTTVTDAYDAFLAVLDPNGSIQYATYLGGSNQEQADGVAVDPAGYAYVTGYTQSNDFPITAGAWDTTFASYANAFVTKILPAAYATPAYSTYLDDGSWTSDYDRGRAIRLDSAGQAYVGGLVYPDASQGKGFVGKFDPNGSSYACITRPASVGYWVATVQDIAVDDIGAVYAVGYTNAQLYIPWIGQGFNGGYDAFVFKMGWNQLGDSVVVVTPDGGEVWRIGRTMTIDWSSCGVYEEPGVSISLRRNGAWEELFSELPNDGSEPWTVTGSAATDCLIEVWGYGRDWMGEPVVLWDMSNAVFSIANPGDLDGDGDVDADDLAILTGCLAGPGVGGSSNDFANADLNDDGDVDLADFAAFQAVFTGG